MPSFSEGSGTVCQGFGSEGNQKIPHCVPPALEALAFSEQVRDKQMLLRPSLWLVLWPRCNRRCCSPFHGQVPYAVERCRKRDKEQQGYKELFFLRVEGHVDLVAENTQGYLKANPGLAGTGSSGGSSCVDNNGRT